LWQFALFAVVIFRTRCGGVGIASAFEGLCALHPWRALNAYRRHLVWLIHGTTLRRSCQQRLLLVVTARLRRPRPLYTPVACEALVIFWCRNAGTNVNGCGLDVADNGAPTRLFEARQNFDQILCCQSPCPHEWGRAIIPGSTTQGIATSHVWERAIPSRGTRKTHGNVAGHLDAAVSSSRARVLLGRSLRTEVSTRAWRGLGCRLHIATRTKIPGSAITSGLVYSD